jgi:uncharacterized protein (DUF2237 family)
MVESARANCPDVPWIKRSLLELLPRVRAAKCATLSAGPVRHACRRPPQHPGDHECYCAARWWERPPR